MDLRRSRQRRRQSGRYGIIFNSEDEGAATLQIGPVIFGTAVRDSLPFIAFGNFVNQIQYAEVSRALNDRAVALAHAGLTPPPRTGSTIAFVGAMTDPSETGETTITVLRVRSANRSDK